MDRLISLYTSTTNGLSRAGDAVLPLAARFVFAATLFSYFWVSAKTKVGEGFFGLFSPSFNGYAQIFPKQMEAISYDITQLGLFHWAVVTAGMWAEFILPVLIVIGLATRLASVGMIGFVIVQSLTDLYGHGGIAHPETLGAWFDKIPDALILDQRAFWMLLFGVLVFKGAGVLSVDQILRRRAQPAMAQA